MVSATVALKTTPWTAPLKNGEVPLKGFELEFTDYVGWSHQVPEMRKMIRELCYDACEMSWYAYLAARERGTRFTAIPYWPQRSWPHEEITVNTRAGIASPKDLEGKRVALRTYCFTPATWLRALLTHDYGVDIGKVTFVISGEEHFENFELPPNVELMLGADLGPMVFSGELDAAIGLIEPDGKSVVPLFSNPKELHNAWRSKGLIPIDHVIVIRDEFIVEYPEFPGELLRGLVASTAPMLERLVNDQLTAADVKAMDFYDLHSPESFAAGVEPNRFAIEASVRFAVEQGLLSSKTPIEGLFAKV